MGIETPELGLGEPGSSVWKWPSTSTLVEDIDRDGVEGDGGAQPLLGGGLEVVGDLVEGRRASGQLVGLAVEELGHGREKALVDTFFALVAGDLFYTEHLRRK